MKDEKHLEWFVAWRWQMAGDRAKRAITQAQAARLLGVTDRTIRKWEDGERTPPVYLALACSALLHGLPPFASHR